MVILLRPVAFWVLYFRDLLSNYVLSYYEAITASYLMFTRSEVNFELNFCWNFVPGAFDRSSFD